MRLSMKGIVMNMRAVKRSKMRRKFIEQIPLFLFILPGIILVLLFNYIPMTGLQLAFRDFQFSGGIWGSPFVGLENFRQFLLSADFWRALKNTAILIPLRLLVFPAPIVLALLLNEIRNFKFKRTVQTISYLPHFVSWVVIVGIMDILLSIDSGAVNSLIKFLGGKPIPFMGMESWFRPLYIISGVWKEIGWGSILYLAAISNINPELYEAAEMDGAGRLGKMWYITLPGMVPIISIVLVLSMPGLLSAGMDQILQMQNPANMGVTEVIDTFVVRLGIGRAQYSITTAIGLVMSVFSTTLLLVSNNLSKLLGGEGIW